MSTAELFRINQGMTAGGPTAFRLTLAPISTWRDPVYNLPYAELEAMVAECEAQDRNRLSLMLGPSLASFRPNGEAG